MNINAKSEDVITIKETIENGYVTRSVYSNGYMCYSQTKDLQLMKNRDNDTWVDSFYRCLNRHQKGLIMLAILLIMVVIFSTLSPKEGFSLSTSNKSFSISF